MGVSGGEAGTDRHHATDACLACWSIGTCLPETNALVKWHPGRKSVWEQNKMSASHTA